MIAAVLRHAGAGPDGLVIEDVPVPELEPGEVLVAVRAVSASKLELEQTLAGVGIGRAVRTPRTVGMDPAGIVVAQGDEVRPELLGTRVVIKPNLVCGECALCRDGIESDCRSQQLLGTHRDGGAAEFVAVPARQAFAIPEGLDFQAAAATIHSVSVALHMLRRSGLPGPTQTVLVLGASGAVGSAAVQLAAASGARVISAVSGIEKAAGTLEDGAGAWVDSSFAPALEPAVRAHAPGGVDIVIDAAGAGDLLSAAIDALAWRGTAVSCASRPGAALTVDLAALYRGRRTVQGVAGTDFADVRDALTIVAEGRVRPRVAAIFPLRDVARAYRALGRRDVSGKVLLTV